MRASLLGFVLLAAAGVAWAQPANKASREYPPRLPGAKVEDYGEADTTVPYATASAFAKAMVKAGNRCEIVGYAGQQHGFFNYGRGNNQHYAQTTRKMDEFFGTLGYLTGPPTLEVK